MLSFIRDLGEFFGALFFRLEILATGGGAAIMTWGITQYFGETVPFWVWAAIIGITFFLGAFLAWRDQYQKVANDTPKLSGRIVHIIGFSDKQLGNAVALYVSLKNVGSDSIAERFSVTHILDDIVTPGYLVQAEEDLKLQDGSVIKQNDYLLSKVAEMPIAKGSQRYGVILSQFKSLTPEKLGNENVKYDISFFDILNTKITISTSRITRRDKGREMKIVMPGFESVLGSGVAFPKGKTGKKKKP